MFTGLIEETGKVFSLEKRTDGSRLTIEANVVVEDAKIGDSIAVNGVCLTVVNIKNKFLSFDVSPETLKRTNLETLKTGELVNLERALRPSDRLGGHIVQGHIDTVGKIVRFSPIGEHWELNVEIPSEFSDFVVEKGSIAIDGISLTINQIRKNIISINIIPHTREVTNLKQRKAGDFVNLEFDILAKYVVNLLKPYKETRLKNLLENL